MSYFRVAESTACLFLCLLTCTPQFAAAQSHGRPYRAPRYVFACDRWQAHEPSSARGLYDVSWTRERLSRAELGAIEAVGGVVVYEFNVCALRARLWTDSIPRVADIATLRIESVDAPSDHVVSVRIRMPLPRSDADRQFLIDLGAVITREDYQDVLAYVPDSAIPAIRASPRVDWVKAAGQFGCFD